MLILITQFAVADKALAQYTGAGISVQGGMSYISLKHKSINLTKQSDPLFCFKAGVFGRYKLTRHSGIEAELNYLLQQGTITLFIPLDGANGDSAFNTGTEVITSKLGYLSLPFRYSYSIHHFTISGGLQLGWVIHQRALDYGTAYSSDSVIFFSNEFPKPIVQNFDMGISIGVMEDISSNFFVSLHAYHSILNIAPNKENDGIRRNSNIVAGIGYRILKPAKKSKAG